jgi:hypothetical protein
MISRNSKNDSLKFVFVKFNLSVGYERGQNLLERRFRHLPELFWRVYKNARWSICTDIAKALASSQGPPP